MQQHLGQISLVVDEYDRALEWFTEKLRFEIVEDTPQPGKRWVIVKPPGDSNVSLLLARAKNEQERKAIGNQTGGRVAFFLYTDDFSRDYQHMRASDVEFIGEPRNEPYGKVIVFRDLYGNKWDFIEPRQIQSEASS